MGPAPVDPNFLKTMEKIPKIFPKGWFSFSLLRFIGARPPQSAYKSKVRISTASQAPRRTLIFEPETQSESPRPAIMMIHGGGHIMGSPINCLPTMAMLAVELDCIVVSPSYRFSPEHPFPADLDDCHAAWQWLQDNAKRLKIDPSRIGLCGNSAGGGLAAALALRLRDEGAKPPIAQALIYPMLDDRTALNRELDGQHLIWYNEINQFAWEAYLAPLSPGDKEVPALAAPARATDLSGQSPTWIGIGSSDLFWEEDVAYAQRLEEAGVACTLKTVDNAPHGFDLVKPNAPQSKDFNASLLAFFRAHF